MFFPTASTFTASHCRKKGGIFLSTMLCLLGLFFFPCPAKAVERVIVARGSNDYPPYEFINDDGEPDGFNVELLKAVGKTMGFSPFILLGSWNEIRKDLLTRRIDMLTGMFFSPRRDTQVDFSIPFLVVNHAIFIRKSSPIMSLDDLKGKTILVQDGDIMHEWASKKLPSSILLPVLNQPTALKRLAAGEADCALLGKFQGIYNAKRFGLTNITPIDTAILPQHLCFAVPHGRQELQSMLNEGLSLLKETGEYDRIYTKWFGVYPEKHFPTHFIFWGLAAILITAGAGIIWNWSLRRRVFAKTSELNKELAQRTRTEEALKQKEEDLRHSLGEQEVLLKEIHHRVKNNLQIISSLLALQMDQLDTNEAKEVFIVSQRRITSMALVHQQLYQSQNLSKINLADYVKKLVASYKNASLSGRRVSFNVQVQSLELPVNKAIPCGLILNELITNALKHALKDNGGSITIHAERKEQTITMKISDTGPGFPEGFSKDKSQGLGIQLVLGLTSQLEGEISLENSPGASVIIVFEA